MKTRSKLFMIVLFVTVGLHIASDEFSVIEATIGDKLFLLSRL